MKVRALLFDFDGVLVDTEPVHMASWRDILAPLGIRLTVREYFRDYLGINDRDFLRRIFRDKGKKWSPSLARKLIQEKELLSKQKFLRKIPLIAGAGSFLKKIAPRIPCALVTGALPSEVTFILKRLGWRRFFPVCVTSANVRKGKPDPEGFLKAFRHLRKRGGFSPPLKKSECLILEDSKAGISAAKRAKIPFKRVQKRLAVTGIIV